MVGQENEFLVAEGDAWHARNVNKPYNLLRNEIINRAVPEVSSIVEIGCGNGRSLRSLKEMTGAIQCIGVDISEAAIRDGKEKFPELKLIRGTAQYRFWQEKYDLVVYGFCLYVCDPESLLMIAAIGNSILKNKGYLSIHDFDPEHSHKVAYKHVDGLFSYKHDYSKLWLANPAYSLVSKTLIGDGTAVWVLKKDIDAGWPLEDAP
jgi:SAM-dependent methyltransferase